ncbi:hypothetical protein GUJ93_ZPchr0013g34097 [Zizania palustris]|uniref:Uncharacterized protein n=1 Tax=Zizania palustris TaxID=103762 RepID=A0A8J5WWR2_ZIZPA|nr:hypothetical protein GUJ93_ZPchr0013g34097 [Zizania palustris]
MGWKAERKGKKRSGQRDTRRRSGVQSPNPQSERDRSTDEEEELGSKACSLASMDASPPSPAEAVPRPEDAAAADDDDEGEWDADGFVIPNLSAQENDVTEHSVPKSKDPEPLQEKEEKIYLGPHGAPPSQAKQQEFNTVGRKQRFRNKLKEADSKFTGNGHENKVESLRELMGAKTDSKGMPKGSPPDWLDPHCHESEFDRKKPQQPTSK